MSWKQWTVYFTLITFAAIGVWDVWVISQEGTEASISYLLIHWAYDYPAFPFTMGFVMGHLFWQLSSNRKEKT